MGPPIAVRLPRIPKGRRARFFDEPAIDQLFGIVTALTGDVSVAFERIRTLERVSEKRGNLKPGDLEARTPDESEATVRVQATEALIGRVFQVLDASVEAIGDRPSLRKRKAGQRMSP